MVAQTREDAVVKGRYYYKRGVGRWRDRDQHPTKEEEEEFNLRWWYEIYIYMCECWGARDLKRLHGTRVD